MLQEGDRVVLVPISSGRYAVIKSDPIKEGDKVLVLQIDGQKSIAIKPPKVKAGDKVIIITTPSGKWAMKYEVITNKIPDGAIVTDQYKIDESE
jgi:ribosomal protein L2